MVLLFTGPSGVGKTELAHHIACNLNYKQESRLRGLVRHCCITCEDALFSLLVLHVCDNLEYDPHGFNDLMYGGSQFAVVDAAARSRPSFARTQAILFAVYLLAARLESVPMRRARLIGALLSLPPTRVMRLACLLSVGQ